MTLNSTYCKWKSCHLAAMNVGHNVNMNHYFLHNHEVRGIWTQKSEITLACTVELTLHIGKCYVIWAVNPYPTAFPYGNGMVLHFHQQQESSMTKTVHKVINKGLKAYVYSPHTGENFH